MMKFLNTLVLTSKQFLKHESLGGMVEGVVVVVDILVLLVESMEFKIIVNIHNWYKIDIISH